MDRPNAFVSGTAPMPTFAKTGGDPPLNYFDLVLQGQGTMIRQCLANEAALERRYHDLVENAVEGIFQTTPDGRFLSANPALARMLTLG